MAAFVAFCEGGRSRVRVGLSEAAVVRLQGEIVVLSLGPAWILRCRLRSAVGRRDGAFGCPPGGRDARHFAIAGLLKRLVDPCGAAKFEACHERPTMPQSAHSPAMGSGCAD